MFRRQGARTKAWAIAFGAMLCVLVLLAPGASAVLTQLPNGHVVSYMPLKGAAVPTPPADATFSNLDYNGGPVMPSNKDYYVYWSPSGTGAYPTGYVSGLNQYFTDLAHDSGNHQNVDSVSTQLNDLSGNFANYNMTFGGGLTDSNGYPANGCTEGTGPTPVCLTDAQVQSQLNTYIAANSLPRGLSTEYFVMFPPGVVTCFDSSSSVCSANAKDGPAQFFCAYHGNVGTGSTAIIYANDNYVTFPDVSGCDDGNHPNGSPSDGALQGGLSHEHNESVTDPVPNSAWADINAGGFENGDKCGASVLGFSGSQGTPLGTAPNSSPYNQLINGHEYLYQMEWSNQGHTCLQRYTGSGALPSASFTYNGAGGNSINVDASNSTAAGGVSRYNWQWQGGPNPPFATEVATATTSHSYGSAGTFLVALTAFAGDGASAGTAKSVKVPAATVAVTNPGNQTGQVGTAVSKQITATRTDSGTLTYSATGLPAGLSISSTGLITGTPTTVGSNSVTVSVHDSSGPTGTTSFSWTINAASGTVTVTNPGSQTGTAGTAVSLQMSATDTAGGTLTWSASGLPTGLSINSSTGKITGTPTTAGVFNLTVTATDSTGPSGNASFSWTISNPVSITNPGNRTGTIGTAVNLQITASTSDAGTLTYSATGLPNGLSINTATGKITGTPTTAGVFNVTVTATDSTGPSKSVSFSWTINPVGNPVSVTNPGSQAGTVGAPVSLQIVASTTDGGTLSYSSTGLPNGLSIGPSSGLITGTPTTTGTFIVTVTAIDSTGPSKSASFSWTINPCSGRGCIGVTVTVTNPGSQTGTVGTAASLQISASSSDGGTLTYSATGLPTSLSINSSTGQITGTPSVQGTFSVTVTATDASGPSGATAFSWTINPSSSATVTVTNPGNQTGSIGTAASLQIQAGDSDGGTLTYSATGLPNGLSINSSTGKITGTPTTASVFNVTVTATDASGPSGNTSFSWTISNPVSITNPGSQSGTIGTAVNLQITASTTDAGTLTYSATGLPNGLSINSSTGKITGTPTTAGVFNVTVTATDSTGPSNSTSFSWTISNPVSITNPGNQSGTIGTAVNLQITASTTDAGTLTYTATGLPNGLSINTSTGKITGTPTTQGSFSVTVTATDSTGPSNSKSFSWTINPAGNPVSITNPGNQTGTTGIPVNLQITASASDGGTLTYSATGLPDGLSIDSSTGLITGMPTTVSVFNVTVTATDSTGPSKSASFSWTISSCRRGCAPISPSIVSELSL